MKSLYLFLFGILMCFTVHADNYYISPSGSDVNNGLSQAASWKTLTKVNSVIFQPGDSILFQAGGVWNGQASPLGSGVSGNPITVDKYGTGNNPVINGSGTNLSAGFSLTNQSYWMINNLEITNTQLSGGVAKLYGILITATQEAGITHISVQNCYIHDVNSLTTESNPNFSKGTGGIIFSGYTNEVLVKGCHVANVTVEGIRNSYSKGYCSHFVVDSNRMENVYGDGIVLHGVNNHSAITRNVLKNTCYNTSRANYAGIWTYASNATVIVGNEVSGITGGGIYDGEPFDADIATDGDIFEYNYTHDNKRGFMLYMPDAVNIVVRYNISVNDVGDGVRLFNYTNVKNNNGNKIYNNVFYIPNNIKEIFENTGKGTTSFSGDFNNNIVYCGGAAEAFSQKFIDTASRFHNNCFYYAQSVPAINVPAGDAAENIYKNPMFINQDFTGSGINNGVQKAYSLSAGSPCINAGILIPDNGNKDFTGKNITGVPPFVGAVSF